VAAGTVTVEPNDPSPAGMKILQVCAVDFTAYHFLLPLMRACRADGWTVEIACADGPWIGALEREGFRHRRIPMSRSRSPLTQLRAVLALAGDLRRDTPDLIHTHTPVGGLVGRLAGMAVPSVPVVHTLHGLPMRSSTPGALERIYLAVERLAARRTAFFFSQAEGDVQRAASLGIIRAGDTLVIGNGIDTDRFAPDPEARARVRSELGIPEAAILAISVGRLVREKGHLEVAAAAARSADIADLHVAIVGQALASDRTSVASDLARHEAGSRLGARWRLLGYRSDVERILQAADIFVLASHREGLPRSVIEAMACGLPVIATAIPAHRELVEPGRTGSLVPVGDVPALAGELRALALDPAARRAMGSRARELALAHHREADVVARQLPVLARIVARG